MIEPNVLMIKTASEISLKSRFVRRFFMKKLRKNIKFALKRNNIMVRKISSTGGRLFVFLKELDKAQSVLRNVFGIHAIAKAQQFKETSVKGLTEKTLNAVEGFLKEGDSFALRVNRVGKQEFSSKELENKIGAAIMKKISNLKVDLNAPEKTVFIELREKNAFIYFDETKCFGGFPVGVEGSVAMFFEGKKEEMVGAWLMLKRGCNVFPVLVKNKKTVEKNLKKLIPWNSFRKFVLTHEKNFKKLVEERNIKAIVFGCKDLNKKTLKKYCELKKKYALAVLNPLLLYPKGWLNEKTVLIGAQNEI